MICDCVQCYNSTGFQLLLECSEGNFGTAAAVITRVPSEVDQQTLK